MKAFIMSAGVGTRLEPLTLAVPKPMVPVCNVPVMRYNIELLKRNGIHDIVANLHYFPEQIQYYFRDGAAFGVRIRYSYEEELLGTAGGVRNMAEMDGMRDELAIVLSSDVLMDIDIKKLVNFHKRKKADATIALVKVDDPSEFGIVVTDKDSRITAFQEKPAREEAISDYANTGVYILSKKALSMIPPGKYDFGKQLFPALVQKNMHFYGLKLDSYWKDIGNIGNYKQANFDMLKKMESRRLRLENIWKHESGSRQPVAVSRLPVIRTGRSCRIDKEAVLEGSVIIGDNCVIRPGARVKDSIIWSDTVIDANVNVDSAIIGSWCYLEEGSSVGRDSIIANRCRIKKGSVIPEGSKLTPDQVV